MNASEEQLEIQNAKVTRVFIGREDHNILTCYLYLDLEIGSQAFGGYGFDSYDKQTKRRIGTAWGCEFLLRILETLEVESFDKLPGTVIRVKRPKGWGGLIHGIGHALKDQWFMPKEDLKHLVPDAT